MRAFVLYKFTVFIWKRLVIIPCARWRSNDDCSPRWIMGNIRCVLQICHFVVQIREQGTRCSLLCKWIIRLSCSGPEVEARHDAFRSPVTRWVNGSGPELGSGWEALQCSLGWRDCKWDDGETAAAVHLSHSMNSVGH